LLYGREGFYVLGGPYGAAPSGDDDEGDDDEDEDDAEDDYVDTRRILVRPYEPTRVVVKLSEALSSGGSAPGAIQQVTLTPNFATVNTGQSTTVFDGFIGGGSLPSGTLVYCEQMLPGDTLLAIQANACPGS
jgi:hypothetical protein